MAQLQAQAQAQPEMAQSEEHRELERMWLVKKDVVKKQTILLFFAVSTTFVYAMFAAVSFEGETLLPLEVAANALCVWFMFAANQRYWRCCAKFGCCCCCYIEENLDDYLSSALKSPPPPKD